MSGLSKQWLFEISKVMESWGSRSIIKLRFPKQLNIGIVKGKDVGDCKSTGFDSSAEANESKIKTFSIVNS